VATELLEARLLFCRLRVRQVRELTRDMEALIEELSAVQAGYNKARFDLEAAAVKLAHAQQDKAEALSYAQILENQLRLLHGQSSRVADQPLQQHDAPHDPGFGGGAYDAADSHLTSDPRTVVT